MSKEPEYTGGSVSYYAVDVARPINDEADPYTAECQDIIDALGMTFNEGSAFKAIWRRAAARNLGKVKRGYDDGLYDAQKVEFYGKRMVLQAQDADVAAGLAELEQANAWIMHDGRGVNLPVAVKAIRLRRGDCYARADGEVPAPAGASWVWAEHSNCPTDIVEYAP